MEPEIIFEDEWMMVVDKPAGMVTNNSQTSGGNTVQEWFSLKYLNSKFEDPNKLQIQNFKTEFYEKQGIVHRLDKDTSGLLVLAKTEEAYEKLKNQFLTRETEKVYWALVHGKMKTEQGIVSQPVVRHTKVWGKFMVGTDLSRMAITDWKVIDHYTLNIEHYSLLELQPMTGRTHQIRVHMQYLGHPIVSDPIYLGKRQLTQDLSWCPRLFLHAYHLELKHPRTEEKVKFTASLPEELSAVLDKWESSIT